MLVLQDHPAIVRSSGRESPTHHCKGMTMKTIKKAFTCIALFTAFTGAFAAMCAGVLFMFASAFTGL